jgi:hypothetical protein
MCLAREIFAAFLSCKERRLLILHMQRWNEHNILLHTGIKDEE